MYVSTLYNLEEYSNIPTIDVINQIITNAYIELILNY